MKYLIFSDESGKWNEGEYYIRSWIKITPEQYNFLRKEVIFSKHETGIKELKWGRFKRNYDKCKNIFLLSNFDVFITISKPQHFLSKKYNIVDIIDKVEISTAGQSLTEKIKRKIINSAQNELFFNYFEKQHIENSKNALLFEENPKDFQYVIDTPQYLDKGWTGIANECGVEQLEIEKKSENNSGVEVADIVSGCISDLLSNDAKAKTIYKDCIFPKMIDMTSKTFPNPNLIFYQDFSEEEKKSLNIFR